MRPTSWANFDEQRTVYARNFTLNASLSVGTIQSCLLCLFTKFAVENIIKRGFVLGCLLEMEAT